MVSDSDSDFDDDDDETAGAIVGGWGNLGSGLPHKANASDSRVFLFYFLLEFAHADEIVSTSAAGSREFSLEEEIRI